MATVHPYKGFLNTEFHIYTKGTEDTKYEVRSCKEESDPIVIGSVSPNIPHAIKFERPGKFRIDFSDGTSSEIKVEDGYKFGGSEHKRSFIFDETPWCFVIMRDRTYFYNRNTEESYVEAISPDKITVISEEFVIFENFGQEERTIYSLHEQKPILNISNIIYYNDGVIVWQEDDNLILFSLLKREIKLRVNFIQYTINKDDEKLIYAYDSHIYQVELWDNCNKYELCKWSGNFLAFINNSLSVICSDNKNTAHLQIVNHLENEIVKELDIEGCIASVNGHNHININTRINAIRDFDISETEFPDAMIAAVYNEITFYPCEWDIFYVVQTTSIYKSASDFKTNELITLRSIGTDLAQKLSRYSNKTIITNQRFLLYNDKESFVNSKYYSAAGYNEGGKIYVHKNKIVLSKENVVYTLSKNGFWDNRIERDYDFSNFEKFGIVFNNETKEYHSFLYNIKGNEITHYSVPKEYVTLGNSIVFAGGKVLFDKSKFKTFSNIPLGISPSYQLGIGIRGKKVFITSLNGLEEKSSEILKDQYDSSCYHQVLLSENGSQIMYRKEDKTEVKDILTGEVFTFDNPSYVQQCNGIRPSFKESSSLLPRIVNPITGQTLNTKEMTSYISTSPDGKYYAETLKDMYVEYYYPDTNETIDKEEFEEILKCLEYPSKQEKDSQEWKDVTHRRILFVEKHFQYINKEYPQLTNGKKDVDNWKKSLIDSDNECGVLPFVRRAIAVRGIALIRNMSDDSIVAKIDLGLPLSFINYVSFSYDSRFVSLAGYKDFSYGLFLVYDIERQQLLYRKETNRAVWTAVFSSKNAIAGYTSDPYTIIIEDAYGRNSNGEFNEHLIDSRNFLTFSPDGSLLALSNQGYISKYDINGDERSDWGHQSSTFVEVMAMNNLKEPITIFDDLSDSGIVNTIKPRTVASVSFSNDNSRLMMVGNDGVVIIRNLHFDNHAGE